MTATTRFGIVGLGVMGRNHVRVARGLEHASLEAVFDPAGDLHGAAGGCSVAADLEAFSELVDAAVIAVPTEEHLRVGLQLIEAGIHLLIEKPLATSVAEGQQLVDAATAAGVTLAVGHIERFNPAIRALKERLAADELGDVYQISTSRQGPFPARIRDVGVIRDLATHDIDLTQFISASQYDSVSARTTFRTGRPHEDLVSAVGSLKNGTVVNHMVNWLTPTKERQVVVTAERGRFVADTLTADLSMFENGSVKSQWDQMSQFRGVSEGNMIRYAIPKPEPLKSELEGFVEQIRSGNGDIVTGDDGLRVLSVAQAMIDAANNNTVEMIR